MTRLVRHGRVDEAVLAGILAPRCGLVGEDEVGPGRFVARCGPVRDYERTVVVDRPVGPPASPVVGATSPSGGGSTSPVVGTPTSPGSGQADVTQVVEYRLAVPLIGWLLALPSRRVLGRLGGGDRPPWWGPPDLLDRQAWAALAALATLATVIGYLSTLLTQTVTYSAREFHAGTGAEGVALAVIRGDVVLSVGLVALADRRGRRAVALGSAGAGCALTAVDALVPSLPWLAASQLVARGFVTAASIAAAVLVAESMPKGARAWAIGVIAMATAVGAGVCVLSLPVAGLGVRAWRLLYAAAALWLGVVALAGRRLVESERYQHRRATGAPAPDRRPAHALWGRRLALLAIANFLFQAFITPASQFQNEYLRRERAFSPGRISLFTILTVLPGAIGIVVGGRLADTRGRRRVGMIAVLGAAVGGAAAFSIGGWPMWGASAVASLTGAAVIPAISVYGPELFGTSRRGAANGLLTAAGRVGGVGGLLLVGGLAEWLGRFGPAFAILAAGPVLLAVLILVAFPETARRSLEELNPSDAGELSQPADRQRRHPLGGGAAGVNS